jgi:hypothetical protein
MPTNEQVAEKQEVADLQTRLEEKFLRILAEPDVVIPSEEIAKDGKLTEEQRATLQKVLESEMPTPEEIQQSARMAKHNEEIRLKREEKQAAKKARRAVIGRNKKRRRRR